MSATQVVLAVLVLVAFALGWIVRGRRDSAESGTGHAAADASGVDAALGAALTSFQAALALWQLDEPATTSLASRTLATFMDRRAAVSDLAGGTALLARAEAALDVLADGLEAWTHGAALDAERERALLRAERKLTAARSTLLLEALGIPPADDPPRAAAR